MNASIRERYEARVLRNETIEVHLQYLRSGFDAVQAALPVLRDKIDLLSSTMDSKIEKTNAKIEAVSASLGEKIDKANEQRAAGDVALGERIDAAVTSLVEKMEKMDERRAAGDTVLGGRIDKLTDAVSQISSDVAEGRGYQKTVSWVLSLAGIAGAVISIARTLDWI